MFNLKSPVIIIGMHRSGTSYLSRVLTKSSVYMGQVMNNNHESYSLLNFNNYLLEKEGACWSNPKEVSTYISLKKKIKGYFAIIKHIKTIKNLTSILKGMKWGWKDPRNTFTLSFWLFLFPKAKVVFVHRNAADSAFSLYKRNSKMNTNQKEYVEEINRWQFCIELWEKYNLQALKMKEECKNFHTVKFEDLLKFDEKTILELEQYLDVKLKSHLIEPKEAITGKDKKKIKIYQEMIKMASSLELKV